MKRLVSSLLTTFALAIPAQAHFLFVVPEPGGQEGYVFLSEDLEPDEAVSAAMLSGATLYLRNAEGEVRPLALELAEDAMKVKLDGTGSRVVFGALPVGVHQVGDKLGNRIAYYTKTILGDPFARSTSLADQHPVELVPVRDAEGMRLRFEFNGAPVADAEVTVFLPDGGRTKSVTDAAGLTKAFSEPGRYGAWTKTKVGGPGELDGKAYAESRGYATIVAELGGATAAPEPLTYAPLPQATSSFGAVESDGWLYVYGGHTARTHDYDTEAVSGRFNRLNLAQGSAWESLPEGPALQGMNLAAHDNKIYRIGGMQPRNPRGSKADNFSVADCVRFNALTMQWEWMAPMPEGRSSHDMAVVGDTLYVIGGWNMHGRIGDSDFLDYMLTLDLSDPRAVWKRVPQPFARRALIVTVNGGKIFVMGGIDEDDEVSRELNIFDTTTLQWSQGPELIGDSEYTGFAPAACTLNGRIYASVAGGHLLRLTEDGSAWEFLDEHTPRIVHRLIPWQSRILVSGGANRGVNSDLIEALVPSAEGVRGTAPPLGERKGIHGRAPVEAAAPQPASGAQKKSESKPSDQSPPISSRGQVFCPVMTNVEVAGDEDAAVVSYEGREVLLCCSKCVKKWEKDPEAYLLPEVLPQITSLELPERTIEQTYCPVYPTRVVSASDPSVIYRGVRVYLFNKTAVRRWNADPAKYADPAVLPQLASDSSEGAI